MMKCRVAFILCVAALSLAACCNQAVKPEPKVAEMKAEAISATAAPANDTAFSATIDAASKQCATSLADCPDEGCGGGTMRDPLTNAQKNRTTVPNDPVELTVGQFKQQFKELTDIGKKRVNLSTQDQRTLETDEAIAVQVDGFVLDDTPEEPESCACYIDGATDYHIWLASTRTAKKPAAIVVEITPRIFDTQSKAVVDVMKRLQKDQVHVRVVGWPMFDPLHPEQLGKTRFTRWEVHPVVDIQEKVNGAWQSVFP